MKKVRTTAARPIREEGVWLLPAFHVSSELKEFSIQVKNTSGLRTDYVVTSSLKDAEAQFLEVLTKKCSKDFDAELSNVLDTSHREKRILQFDGNHKLLAIEIAKVRCKHIIDSEWRIYECNEMIAFA